MSMLKPVILAVSMMLAVPLVAQASEVTVVPAVNLQIGTPDATGQHYWDGSGWRDREWLQEHYEEHDHDWRPYHGDHYYKDYHQDKSNGNPG